MEVRYDFYFHCSSFFIRSQNESACDLYHAEYGRPIFMAIVSEKTFLCVTIVLRFDDVISRRQQRSSDKFAPIRQLFEKWSGLLPDFYNPFECVTVGIKGRCSFRQYMTSKLAKYGLEFWVMACSGTFYVWKI